MVHNERCAARLNKLLTAPLSRSSFLDRYLHYVQVDPTITKPYARLSLEIKQQFDSWEIITETSPFAIAEMFGNIGGFWGE